MMYLLIAIAAATQPTWLSAGPGTGLPLSSETQILLVGQCTQGDGALFTNWLGSPTDPTNPASPTKSQAIGYCHEWANYMGSTTDVNFVVAPMSQLGVACAMYHCLENFFGFTTVGVDPYPSDMENMECVMANLLTSFALADNTFPESYGGPDNQNYARSSCACNAKLAAAAPSPSFPKWLTHTGAVKVCADRLTWDPTNAPFWACSLRACMPKGEMKEYLICTQDTYYGFEGLDQCDKLDKLVLGNIAAPIPLAITGIVFFFLATTLYGIVSLCCSSKKSKQAQIGV